MIKGTISHYTAIINDCLFKSRGRSIYYGIIFWPHPSPTPQKVRMSLVGGGGVSRFSCQNEPFFTLFLGMYYDCQIKVGDRSIYYSTIFWQPPPPPTPTPPPANPTSKSKRGCQSMKMHFFKSSWQKELFHIIFSDHLWLPVLIQGRINILWCYILTPTTTYPSKSQIGCHFMKMLFFCRFSR